MKVDLVYPKIPENSNKFHGKCFAFEKYDGTNLHWNWNQDYGWHSFGTRRTSFSLNRAGIDEFTREHPQCAPAPHIFHEMRDMLSMFLCKNAIFSSLDVTLFTEFYGLSSFAGNHLSEDLHHLVIIDVMINKRLLEPELFIKYFERFGTARLVYSGKYSGQFVEDVRNGKFDVNEGVVIKSVVDDDVFMTKIKTKEYLKRLKNR